MCMVHVHTLHSHPVCPLHGVRALGCWLSVLWDSHLPRPEDQRAGRPWSAPAATAASAASELSSPLTPAKAASQTPLGALECGAPSTVCHDAGAPANTNNAMFALCVSLLYWLPLRFHCAPLAACFVPLCPRYDPRDKRRW